MIYIRKWAKESPRPHALILSSSPLPASHFLLFVIRVLLFALHTRRPPNWRAGLVELMTRNKIFSHCNSHKKYPKKITRIIKKNLSLNMIRIYVLEAVCAMEIIRSPRRLIVVRFFFLLGCLFSGGTIGVVCSTG